MHNIFILLYIHERLLFFGMRHLIFKFKIVIIIKTINKKMYYELRISLSKILTASFMGVIQRHFTLLIISTFVYYFLPYLIQQLYDLTRQRLRLEYSSKKEKKNPVATL